MPINTGKISQIIGAVVDVTFDKQGFEMRTSMMPLKLSGMTGPLLLWNVSSTLEKILSGLLQWIQLTD